MGLGLVQLTTEKGSTLISRSEIQFGSQSLGLFTPRRLVCALFKSVTLQGSVVILFQLLHLGPDSAR